MRFDLENCSLAQKMSMLILGVALCVAIAVAGIGDLLLRRLATDLIQAKSSGSIAFSDRNAIGAVPFEHGMPASSR